jgi:two-component system, cell cycle sensor histidine kinase and response regulator CckA
MASPSFLSPYRRGTVGLVLLLGAGLSFFMWRYAAKLDAERVHVGFLSRAQTQATVANQHLRTYQEMIYSLRDTFLGQNLVSRNEFASVAHELLSRHPGVQALQWVRIVTHAERTRLEKQASQELHRPFVVRRRLPDNTLIPAPNDEEYFVITYVEPLAGNEVVLGYDVTTAPTAPLLMAARQDRQFKVSRTFQLAQSGKNAAQPGIVFILPLWRHDVPGSPVEGFVQGVFHVETMLAQSHGLTTNEALDTYYVDLDPAAEGGATLLYANLGGIEPLHDRTGKITLPPLDDPADFHATISFGGRTWRMIIRLNDTWAQRTTTLQPLMILVGGLITTVLLALFISSLLRSTASIEAEVRERTRQLRESETRLQDIVDHSPALIFLKDPAGRYLLCNQPFAQLCRRPKAEVIGLTDTDLFPADQASLYRKHDMEVITAVRPMEFEEPAAIQGGARIHIVQKFPLIDEQGRAYALCGIATDITDRKAAEENKLTLERQLLESQKLESLGVLAGGIAHDFNNILTAILGNATLAGMDLPSDHRAMGYLQQIERASRRAGDLCAQMLAYAGKASFVTAPVNLTALVRDTAALLEVSVAKRAHLELAVAEDLPSVHGDITQLRQIVMNLVINAADAMGERPDGEISVRTYCRELPADFFRQAVQKHDLPAGRYVGLEVSDTGSGMPPQVLARIFEPFFTTKFSGRGLGLAAVLGIVHSHDGALFVESTVGRGTTFRLFFPAGSGEASFSHSPFALPTAGIRLRGTVLIVDDEEAVRLVAAEALGMLGATPLEAGNGAEALALIDRQGDAIDMVLLDLTMPGMNGEETLRHLRQTHPALRVVIMSGYSEGETMQRCASLGVAGYLSKPFEIGDLIERLRPYLA